MIRANGYRPFHRPPHGVIHSFPAVLVFIHSIYSLLASIQQVIHSNINFPSHVPSLHFFSISFHRRKFLSLAKKKSRGWKNCHFIDKIAGAVLYVGHVRKRTGYIQPKKNTLVLQLREGSIAYFVTFLPLFLSVLCVNRNIGFEVAWEVCLKCSKTVNNIPGTNNEVVYSDFPVGAEREHGLAISLHYPE